METYDPAQRDALYQSFLTTPGERGSVDYKASVELKSGDRFSLRLFRHIIGMANSGGGWIVIGYKEDKRQGFVPDPSHTNAICQSYDTTKLSKGVNSLLRTGTETLNVYVNQTKHPNNNLTYPIIQVEGFTKSPFFTKGDPKADDKGQLTISPGVLYVRRPGAETVALSDPSDWERLIDLCMQLRRDEFLRQLEDLLNRMGLRVTVSAPTIISSDVWMDEMRRRAIGQK